MNKNSFALTPPMGWNSYDYYDTTVNEEQVKANADYMAAHLKEYGWEYVVVDIQWYAWGQEPCGISISISRSAVWRWMNMEGCFPVRSVSLPQKTERAFSLWQIISIPLA